MSKVTTNSLLTSLTPREVEVARLLHKHKLNKVLGRELGISEKTIVRHKLSIASKLSTTTMEQTLTATAPLITPAPALIGAVDLPSARATTDYSVLHVAGLPPHYIHNDLLRIILATSLVRLQEEADGMGYEAKPEQLIREFIQLLLPAVSKNVKAT